MENSSLQASSNEIKNIGNQLRDMGVSTGDLIIPKLLLMQNTSELVGDGTAQMGGIVNSQTLETVGTVGSPVELIPLSLKKTWRIYDMTTGQAKYARQEDVTKSNENLPYEFMENGAPMRRDMCFNFHVLIQKEVEAGEGFPALITFKRTGVQAGKQIATQLFKNSMLGKAPYCKTVMIGAKKEKKETNTYAVFTCAKGKDTDTAALAEAERWSNALRSMTYKVDETDDEVPAPVFAKESDVF